MTLYVQKHKEYLFILLYNLCGIEMPFYEIFQFTDVIFVFKLNPLLEQYKYKGGGGNSTICDRKGFPVVITLHVITRYT